MKRLIHINLTYHCNRSCSYCFAKGFLQRWPKEITLEGLETVFKWLVKQRVKTLINFLGGEPTLFGEINSALDLAEKHAFRIVLNTNGIFDVKRVNIESPAISVFAVTLNPPSEYSSQELKTLYSNLKAMRKVKRVIFRFNITSFNVSYNYLIDTCKKLNVNHVEFGLVFPSTFNQNEYIKKENLKDFSQYILRLAKDLLRNNIRPVAGEPIPLCLFSEKERDFLVRNSNLRGVCWAEENYAITPDLTVLPCVGLAIEGPSLNTFKSEKEITVFFKKIINELQWEVNLFPQCKDCVFKKNKQCQAGCLTRKLLQVKDAVKLTDRNLKPPSIH